jgi:hypothetical protein
MVENADRLVSSDELMEAVWPDIFVTDDGITQALFLLCLGNGGRPLKSSSSDNRPGIPSPRRAGDTNLIR